MSYRCGRVSRRSEHANSRMYLEQETLDLDSPGLGHLFDDGLNLGGDLLAVGEEVLEVARSHDVPVDESNYD